MYGCLFISYNEVTGMRVAPAVKLSAEARLSLEKLSRRRTTPMRVVQRSRIILLAAEGMQNKEIAERLGIAPRMAALWRDRFGKRGVEGLLKDAPRPGRTPRISAELAAQVVTKTTQSKPAGATHWSRSTMAREIGISDSSVGRIWRAHGLKPHRLESFKVSNDPHFAEKLEAIVGLYLNPPEHALVLSDPFAIIASVKDESRRSLPVIRKKQIDITESSSVKSCRDQNPFHLHLR
jgi:transposase